MRVCSTMWIAVSVDACGLAPPFGGLRWRRRCSLRASGWARRRCAEARAVARQDPQELLVAARRDLRDVLDRGLRQLAEAKLAGGGAHPDPVRRERVSATWLAWQAMRACTSSRSAVAALHHRQRAHLSLADRMQAELSLPASSARGRVVSSAKVHAGRRSSFAKPGAVRIGRIAVARVLNKRARKPASVSQGIGGAAAARSEAKHVSQRSAAMCQQAMEASRPQRGQRARGQLSVRREINWPSCADPSPLFVARRSHTPGMLAPRALRAGRLDAGRRSVYFAPDTKGRALASRERQRHRRGRRLGCAPRSSCLLS